jgi:hypothetical protein
MGTFQSKKKRESTCVHCHGIFVSDAPLEPGKTTRYFCTPACFDAEQKKTKKKVCFDETGVVTFTANLKKKRKIEASVSLPFSVLGESASGLGSGLGTFDAQKKLEGALKFLDEFANENGSEDEEEEIQPVRVSKRQRKERK